MCFLLNWQDLDAATKRFLSGKHTVVYLHRQFSFRPSTGVTVKNVIFEHLGNMVTVMISFVQLNHANSTSLIMNNRLSRSENLDPA